MMYQIGIDIGGTNIKIGLVNSALELVLFKTFPFSHDGPEAVSRGISDAIREMLHTGGIPLSAVESIGLVVPGSIDATGEVVVNSYNLRYHDVPLRKMLAGFFPQIPIYMANDADGATLAELYKGALLGCSTGLLLTLGTGLGGGLIIGGKLFRGGRRFGTEPGHAYLVAGGVPCTCGNKGCMESYCSASALGRQGAAAMREHPESLLAVRSGANPALVDAKLVTDCAKAGDAAALAVFEQYVDWLGSACASFCNILDPEVIALGGGLCAAGDFLFSRLRKSVLEKCYFGSCGEIVPAVMGNDAGIIGAAMLHRDALR